MRIPATVLSALCLLASSLSGADGAPVLLMLKKVPGPRPFVVSGGGGGGSSGTVIPSTLERLGFQDRLSDAGHGPDRQRLSPQRRPSPHRRPDVLAVGRGGNGEEKGKGDPPAAEKPLTLIPLIPLDTEGLTSQVYLPCDGGARREREGSPHYGSGYRYRHADRLICATVIGVVAGWLAAELCSLIYVRLRRNLTGEGSIRLEEGDEKSLFDRPGKLETDYPSCRTPAPQVAPLPLPPPPSYRGPETPLVEKQ